MVTSIEVNRRETREERVDKAARESGKNRHKEDTGSVHLLRVRRQKQTVREESSGVDRGY